MITPFLACAFAVAVLTLTITKSHLSRPARDWMERELGEWPNIFVNCPFCVSHWVSFFVIFLHPSQFRVTTSWLPLDFIISWFALVGVANVIIGVIYKPHEG